MPKQGKSPKKKTKEKSPQRTEESEYPEMPVDQDVYNRLLHRNFQLVEAARAKSLKGRELEGSNKGIYRYSFQEEICCS